MRSSTNQYSHVNDNVQIERISGIGLVEINNPPVNACGHSVREGLIAALNDLQADSAIQLIGIYCAGNTFIAGADIKEFGLSPKSPTLPEVTKKIEDSPKTIITILHGTALGGGLEIALASHFPVGLEGVKVGLPENLLGVLPGAGGTQRLPRITGIRKALDLIISGKKVNAADALELGIIKQLRSGDPKEVALEVAQGVINGTNTPRRLSHVTVEPDDAALDEMRKQIQKKSPHLFSPLKCVNSVAASVLPLEEGLKQERQNFLKCLDSPQRAGLVHAFFAERACSNIPEKKVVARPTQKIGVIGAGTMGAGIATAALLAGLNVTLVEINGDAMERGKKTIQNNVSGAIKRGKISESQGDAYISSLSYSDTLDALSDRDIVIEAIFEDMDVKKQIFGQLDSICKPGSILASNTSYLDLNEIASSTTRPQDVIGLHFFSPAHIMKLLEVVVGNETADAVVATGFTLAKRLTKIAVRSGVCDGFIGNRINAFTRKMSDYLIMDGATPAQVDQAMEEFGFAMGVFKVNDLAGLDIAWANRKRQATTRPATERYIKIADKLCEREWFGRKSSMGYYDYSQASLVPNPKLNEIISECRKEAGVSAREFTNEEIIERFMTAMISEAVRTLEEGIALRPIDIDAVFLFGFGFPRFRGGPLHYADSIGGPKILIERIEKFATEDNHYWQVPTLLKKMAKDGLTFADLNKE